MSRFNLQKGAGVARLFSSKSSSAFNPSSISNLAIWLDETSIQAFDGKVAAWNNKIPNGLIAAARSVASRPDAMVGSTGLLECYFNGSSHLVTTPIDLSANRTLFIAWNPTDGFYYNALANMTGAPYYEWMYYFGEMVTYTPQNGVSHFGFPLTAGVRSIETLLCTPSTWTTYKNGIRSGLSINPGSTDGQPSTNGYAFGSLGGNGQPLTGTIYEILVYDKTLSVAEVAKVTNYLKAKWSI